MLDGIQIKHLQLFRISHVHPSLNRYYTIRGKFSKMHPDLAKIGVKKIIIDFKKERIGFIFTDSADRKDENGWTQLHHASFKGKIASKLIFIIIHLIFRRLGQVSRVSGFGSQSRYS